MICVNPINNTNNLNFKSYRREFKDASGYVVNRCDTCLFRFDLDFDKLIMFLENKYKDVDRVKIINQACSDGEESHSLVALIIYMLGVEKSQKYLPVFAEDLLQDNINIARRGIYTIQSFERPACEYYLEDNLNEYFIPIRKNTIKVNKKVRKNILFEQMDILDSLKIHDFKNTVLLARNFWDYLTTNQALDLVSTLAMKMDKTSTLVIGQYDKQFSVDNLLKNYGFQETEVSNVFELKL